MKNNKILPFNLRKHLGRCFKFAWKGIRTFYAEEYNARIHSILAITVIIAGFCFNITKTEWAIVVICCGLVIAAEAVNTAIERLVDLVSPDYHPLAGKIKDMAAGAVLICAIASAIVGLIIFTPCFFVLIKRIVLYIIL
ncbi:Undecaprenol kinase [termite gut metagenome]|uniref:Undecaprenol kinase n=1 Tax=termite gut metagenome TaxID=433724 RepID=A0A5J4SPX9_9ZZZZ